MNDTSLTPQNGDLVYADDAGALVTTSLVVAEQTGNQHKNIIALVRENLDDLNDVGRVAFETRPVVTSGNTPDAQQKYAVLDEPAAALLMTYLRNTPKIKAFKKALVAEFYAMRGMLVGAESMSQFDVLRHAIDGLEAAHRVAEEAKQIAQRSEARLDGIEGKHDWFSALAFARLNGLPTYEKFLRRLGSHATMVARAHDIAPEKAQHGHYGAVNRYPEWIWQLAADAMGGDR